MPCTVSAWVRRTRSEDVPPGVTAICACRHTPSAPIIRSCNDGTTEYPIPVVLMGQCSIGCGRSAQRLLAARHALHGQPNGAVGCEAQKRTSYDPTPFVDAVDRGDHRALRDDIARLPRLAGSCESSCPRDGDRRGKSRVLIDHRAVGRSVHQQPCQRLRTGDEFVCEHSRFPWELSRTDQRKHPGRSVWHR